MSQPKVTLLTASPLCKNPRVLKEARTLAERGFATRVLTVRSNAVCEELDRELLAGAGFEKQVVENSPAARLLTKAARKGGGRGLLAPFSLGPWLALSRAFRRDRADLTLVHTELPLCILARQPKQAALVDFEDWYSEDLLPEARRERPLSYLRGAEAAVLRRHRCYTTSEALAVALEANYGCPRPAVVRNVFPLQASPSPCSCGTPVRLVWFSQTIGAGRGLEEFLVLLRQTERVVQLTLVGSVADDYLAGLHALLGQPIQHQPAVAPEALPALLSGFDVGLALELATPPSRDLTITNKVFQYLNAGLAVISTDTRGQREVFAPSMGLLLEGQRAQGETVARLRAFLEDASCVSAAKRANRVLAEQRYCWEREAETWLGLVRSSLGVV